MSGGAAFSQDTALSGCLSGMCPWGSVLRASVWLGYCPGIITDTILTCFWHNQKCFNSGTQGNVVLQHPYKIRSVIKEEFCFLSMDQRYKRNDLLFRKMLSLNICSGDLTIQQHICSNTCLSILTSRIVTFYVFHFSEKLWILKKCISIFVSWFHRYIWPRILNWYTDYFYLIFYAIYNYYIFSNINNV